jgi:MFS transporter, AAHS family, 4-hydroxybenzoate transporter
MTAATATATATATPTAAIDVHALIERGPIGRLQKLVLFFGFCIITLEGFDISVMSFIAPVLKQQWHLGNHALGAVLSVTQAGLALGALTAGPLADRFGRKLVVLVSMVAFGLLTLATALATGLAALIVLRLLVGFAIGSVVPNTLTLVSEYMPERIRAFSVALIICAVAFSGTCGGFLSAVMIPQLGWQSVLILGGVLPLLLVPVLVVQLPESVRFLIVRRAPADRILAIVDHLAPGVATAQSAFVLPVEPAQRGAIRTVLSARYRFGSLMLWTAYFAALFASNILSGWLPTLMKESGYSLGNAAFLAGIYQLGGVVGSLVLGWTMDRGDAHKVPPLAYFASGALLFGLSATYHVFPLIVVEAFLLGFCLIGAISGANALSAVFHPTVARATGSGWMHGAGRWGAFLAILSGAQMLELGWNAAEVFRALIVPAVLAGLALVAKARHRL